MRKSHKKPAGSKTIRHMEFRERALQLATARAAVGAEWPELFRLANEIYRFIASGKTRTIS